MLNYKPITQGQRNKKAIPSELTKSNKPFKPLISKVSKLTGVNNQGKKTTRHKGGGVKRKFRIVDFKRIKVGEVYKVLTIEYDPNRSAYVSLICNKLGKKIYILAPNDIKVGDIVENTNSPTIKIGDCTTLDNIPLGTFVHNIELTDKKGFQLCRAAGTYATVIAKADGFVTIKLPSNEVRLVSNKCKAVVGRVSCTMHKYKRRGKAGISRKLGIRPTVRGAAMNAADHPHGGGEGKAPVGHDSPRTPWGKKARRKTRKNTKRKYLVKDRRG